MHAHPDTHKQSCLQFYFSNNVFIGMKYRVVGFPPLISNKTIDKQVKEGDTINITCETEVTQASSVFHLNWYLIESTHNTKKDVAGLERHSLINCGLTR